MSVLSLCVPITTMRPEWRASRRAKNSPRRPHQMQFSRLGGYAMAPLRRASERVFDGAKDLHNNG